MTRQHPASGLTCPYGWLTPAACVAAWLVPLAILAWYFTTPLGDYLRFAVRAVTVGSVGAVMLWRHGLQAELQAEIRKKAPG